MISIKRIYDTPSEHDGRRILVDRLWPRGVSKQKAKIDAWVKELAPSKELRTWFDHDPQKWVEFQIRYRAELDMQTEALQQLAKAARGGTLTLIYAAKDEAHNHAVILSQVVEGDQT